MSDLKVNPTTVEFLKQEQAKRRKRRAIASVLGLAMVASISTAGYFGWNKYRANQQVADARALVAAGDRAKVREAVDNGVITGEQVWAAWREAREKQEQAEMDGYFKTPAKDRQAYLDKLIDDEAKRREEWMRNRPTTRPNWGDRRGGPTSRPTEAEREARGRARADNQSPVQRAQNSEYRAARRAREAARGIQGGRGGFGGGGRGRGDR